jgi:predicted transcriptional regulator
MSKQYKTRGNSNNVPTPMDLPLELRKALDKFAESEERTLTVVVRRALREYLEAQGVSVDD